MTEIEDIITSLGEADRRLRETPFLAPRVDGGCIQTRLEGLVRQFDVRPDDFEGWGIFEARDASTAELEREARRAEIESYLELFEPLRALLVEPLDEGGWFAIPSNRADMRQRFGEVSPIAAHLVRADSAFTPVLLRFDGSQYWFERRDRRLDPRCIDRLREAWHDDIRPENLQGRGLTPEMRSAYAMRWSGSERTKSRAERRLDEALETAGGELCHVDQREAHLRVEWQTSEGERHVSTIAPDDLTVLSAGICLSGRSREFDLESLVGVIEKRPRWMSRPETD